ncbi:MAG: T9SS type A sorting domain-containing protein [Bacteroidales bacterium]
MTKNHVPPTALLRTFTFLKTALVWLFFFTSIFAQAQTSWTLRTSAADNAWTGLTYGNGLFVAVASFGTGNRVMTSPDGITWTIRTSAVDNDWSSITYGNGLFVAVARSGTSKRVMTSPDGITWTARTSPIYQWTSVTYGNGLFVAVSEDGFGNKVMTSPDGITWTARTSAADNAWNSVTFGNGLFVAVAADGVGNRVMTSPDGITWTIRTSAADNVWTSVTYGNGLFVAVSRSGNGNRVMTSPDGIVWTSKTSASDYLWTSVTYGNGLFVAVSIDGTGNRSMTSPDGITWTSKTTPADDSWNCVTYGNGLFVSISNTFFGNKVMTWSPSVATAPTVTTQAVTSIAQTIATGNGNISALGTPNPTAYGVCWNTTGTPTTADNKADKGAASAVGAFTADMTGLTANTKYYVRAFATNSVNTSYGDEVSFTTLAAETAPTTWVSRNSAADNQWQNVTYGNGLFVAVSNSGAGNRVMTSPDGINWTSRTSAADNQWIGITFGKGLFVAISNSGSGNRVMTSPDGINWISRTSAADNLWKSVTYGDGLFVAVATSGSGNRVMTSTDGITWTSSAAASDNLWESVTYGNGLFVAVTNNAFGAPVMTSTDGITWSSQSSAPHNSWTSVTYGNGLFVAVSTTGSGNRVMTSPDGITWTSRTAAADYQWQSVTYGNGYFVAVSNSGSGNRVMSSPDGIIWTSQTSAADNLWNSVTYGNGMFVAVSQSGAGNRVMTSGSVTPGTAQTVTTQTVTSITQTTATGNGNITALGTPNPTAYGVCWNTTGTPTIADSKTDKGAASATGAFTADITGLTANTKYYVRAFATNSAGTSYGDEVSFTTLANSSSSEWIIRTSAADNGWSSVAYGNGLFVAVGNSGTGNRVMTSPDGITWTSRTSAADNTWKSVAYGNGKFVAVSYDGTGNRVMTSPDGITWTSRTSAADNQWTSVTYGNGKFVAVAGSGAGKNVMTSPDGIIWTLQTLSSDNYWTSVTYGNGKFVAVAMYTPFTSSDRVMTSSDGITWTSIASVYNSWNSVTYGNGLFVAVAPYGTSQVMTSPDGINWTPRTSVSNNLWVNVTYGNGMFVAVSNSGTGNRVMTSFDGINWTAKTTPADNNWNSVTYGNGMFVAVASSGIDNRVMTSLSAPAETAPTVTTQAVTSIAQTTATGNGNITGLGTSNPTAYGVCWNTTGTPATADSKVDKGAASDTGAFTADMTGLTANTKYYVRAFATNSAGTSYGSEVSFTTLPLLPEISLSTTALTGFGYVVGNGPSTEKSFTVSGSNIVHPIVITPTTNYEISTSTGASFVATNPISIPNGTGTVNATTIYVRLKSGLTVGAYDLELINVDSPVPSGVKRKRIISANLGTNIKTVSCSGSVSDVAATAPTVTTQAVTTITQTTATGNGNITALGTSNPTAYGLCWNTIGTPTTVDSKVDKGGASATGGFTADMTGLTPGTKYYVRAYATNSVKTVYGEEVTFTTLVNAPSALSYSPNPVVVIVNTDNVSSNPTVTGSVESYSVSPALPAGVTLNTTTGVISGIPTVVSALKDYTVTATNESGSTTAKFTLTVKDVPPTPITLSQSSVETVVNSTSINLKPTVTGEGITFSISPALPAGVTLDPSTGIVSGTPTILMAKTTFTITASNSGGSVSTTFTIEVAPTPPTANAAQAVCGSGTIADLIATAPAGTTVRWYDAAVNGNLLASSTSLTTATTYYAESWSGSVASISRTAVVVTVNTPPAKPIIAGQSTANSKVKLCPNDYIVCTNYDSNLSYQWRKEGVDIANENAGKYSVPSSGAGNYSLYVKNPITGCENVSATVAVDLYSVTVPVVYEKKKSETISILIVDNTLNLYASYLWTYADGSALPASIVNNRQFLVLPPSDMSANYKVNIIDNNACTASSISKAVMLKSIEAKVYPTLITDNFNVKLDGEKQDGALTVKIFNQNGNQLRGYTFEHVQSEVAYQINSSGLSSGLYTVEVTLGSYKQTQKVIIK